MYNFNPCISQEITRSYFDPNFSQIWTKCLFLPLVCFESAGGSEHTDTCQITSQNVMLKFTGNF